MNQQFIDNFWNQKFNESIHKYRCCRCNAVKGDQGAWVSYLRQTCKVCRRCKNELVKERKKRAKK